MEAWRQRLVDEAKTWIGTSWHHEGRVKHAGVDCGQFLAAVYINAGLVPDFDTGHYSRDWMLHRSEERFLGWVRGYLDEVPEPMPGDVAVWKVGRCFAHGAIVTAWPTFIHSHRPTGMVCLGDKSMAGLRGREVLFFSMAGRM